MKLTTSLFLTIVFTSEYNIKNWKSDMTEHSCYVYEDGELVEYNIKNWKIWFKKSNAPRILLNPLPKEYNIKNWKIRNSINGRSRPVIEYNIKNWKWIYYQVCFARLNSNEYNIKNWKLRQFAFLLLENR